MRTERQKDKCIGAILGCAIGDALGTTNEFSVGGAAKIITDIVGGGPFDLPPGYWTDDTSMMLCLMDSLIENGFNEKDQLDKYVQWMDHGLFSSTGELFDIGHTTEQSLGRYKVYGSLESDLSSAFNSGNGSIMRIAPVAAKYHLSPIAAIDYGMRQGKTTHSSDLCNDACMIMTELLVNAINSPSSNANRAMRDIRVSKPATPEFKELLAYFTEMRDVPKLHNYFSEGGYVLSSLAFAISCVGKSSSFEEAVLLAANAGGDADTNAAIAGQLAGAVYGYSSIPKKWLTKLHDKDMILYMANALMESA